jgi:hypothetical protein
MPPQDREIPPEAREVSYPTIVNPNPGGLGQRRQNNGLSIFSLPTVENTPKNRQNRHVDFTAQNPIRYICQNRSTPPHEKPLFVKQKQNGVSFPVLP